MLLVNLMKTVRSMRLRAPHRSYRNQKVAYKLQDIS